MSEALKTPEHVDVMDAAEESFAPAGVRFSSIRGGQTPAARQANVDAFVNDPDVAVAVCSLSAAGVGLNLLASNIVLAEMSWTGAEQTQAAWAPFQGSAPAGEPPMVMPRINEVPVRAGRGTIAAMVPSHWPLADLRLQTPELVLRWPSLDDLHALADLAAAGVHDPEVQPFMVAWTDASPEERARSTLQYHWSCWGSWKPSDWMLELAVIRDGVVVGSQGVGGRDFAVLREVHTGSWLGRRYQGQGIGTQMRAAVLALAFDGLGAQRAASAAFEDNPASLGVSHKLGYRDDGIEWHLVRGRPALTRRLRLDRASWQATRTIPVQIHGLPPCLPFFGLPANS